MLDLLFVLLPGRERLIATTQPDETSLIYRTVPTCAYIVSIFDLPVPGRDRQLNRKNETSTSLSPTVLPTNSANPRRGYLFSRTWTRNCSLYSAYFLCRLRQPHGVRISSCFVRRAGPVPPRLSTPLFQISHTILLAGLYTNKSNSFYSKSHMYRVRRKSPNSWFVIDILHVTMSACNSSWT